MTSELSSQHETLRFSDSTMIIINNNPVVRSFGERSNHVKLFTNEQTWSEFSCKYLNYTLQSASHHRNTHMYTNTHTQTYTNTYMYTNTHTYTNIHTYTNTYTYTNIHVHVHQHVHIYQHACTRIRREIGALPLRRVIVRWYKLFADRLPTIRDNAALLIVVMTTQILSWLRSK